MNEVVGERDASRWQERGDRSLFAPLTRSAWHLHGCPPAWLEKPRDRGEHGHGFGDVFEDISEGDRGVSSTAERQRPRVHAVDDGAGALCGEGSGSGVQLNPFDVPARTLREMQESPGMRANIEETSTATGA